jgi:radical SAM-linked protein
VRVRVRFGKSGKVRWASHRDLARMWERALRRARLPVVYTGGFSPRPKLSFGLALPTGAESTCEYLDVELDQPDVDVDALPGLLTPALPTGVDVLVAGRLEERAPSLQQDVTSCEWVLEVTGRGQPELEGAVGRVLQLSSLTVTRERKGHAVTDDIRPAILHLAVGVPASPAAGETGPPGAAPQAEEGEITAGPPPVQLRAELATQPRGLRPAELLAALGPGLEEVRVRRTHQWIERDGARWEPLPLGATDAPRALERAS